MDRIDALTFSDWNFFSSFEPTKQKELALVFEQTEEGHVDALQVPVIFGISYRLVDLMARLGFLLQIDQVF